MRLILFTLLSALAMANASLLRGVTKSKPQDEKRRYLKSGDGGPCGIDPLIFDNLNVTPEEMEAMCGEADEVRDDPCTDPANIILDPSVPNLCDNIVTFCPAGEECYQVHQVGTGCYYDIAAQLGIQTYAATLICAGGGTVAP